MRFVFESAIIIVTNLQNRGKIYENKTGKLIDHIEYEYDSEGRKKGKPIMMSVIIFRVMMNLNIIRKGKLLN